MKILAVVVLLVVWLVPVEAQGAHIDGAGFVEQREGEVKATGLTAVFPEDHICEPISSPFASLPEDRKRVSIPIVSDDDSINPQGSRVG